MNIDRWMEQKRAELAQASRDATRNEVEALNSTYEKGAPYLFEHDGQQIAGAYDFAEIPSDAQYPGEYAINILVGEDLAIGEQCWILDRSGKRLGARAVSRSLGELKRITLSTLHTN